MERRIRNYGMGRFMRPRKLLTEALAKRPGLINTGIWKVVKGYIDVTGSKKALSRVEVDDDYSYEEKVQTYVAALLLTENPCPQSEDEIDEIGIYKNYGHDVNFDDIVDFYNSCTSNAQPSQRKPRQKKEVEPQPQQKEEQNDINDVTPNDYPSYDEVKTDVEDREEKKEYPSYSEVDDEETYDRTRTSRTYPSSDYTYSSADYKGDDYTFTSPYDDEYEENTNSAEEPYNEEPEETIPDYDDVETEQSSEDTEIPVDTEDEQ